MTPRFVVSNRQTCKGMAARKSAHSYPNDELSRLPRDAESVRRFPTGPARIQFSLKPGVITTYDTGPATYEEEGEDRPEMPWITLQSVEVVCGNSTASDGDVASGSEVTGWEYAMNSTEDRQASQDV